jgi:plastocyanin
MPRIILPLALIMAAFALAACGGDDDADGTPTRAPSPTSAPKSATPIVTLTGGDDSTSTPAPTGSPAAQATQPPAAATSTAPPQANTPPPAATTLTLVAQNTAFNTAALSAPAGVVTIRFVNQDTGIAHNVAVADSSGATVGATSITPGPAESTLQLELAAGAYPYSCQVHPDMQGTLSVQ